MSGGSLWANSCIKVYTGVVGELGYIILAGGFGLGSEFAAWVLFIMP
jgi:hypothetical protein